MPLPVVESNDASPWVNALEKLLGDRAEYTREASASRSAAEQFVARLDAADMERYLAKLDRGHGDAGPTATIESLSPEKRALLLDRLRKRSAR